MVKPFIIVMVLLWAVVCSLTRITDHRHHWWDVAVGSILGTTVAFYTIVALCKSFQQPFVSNKSHRPSASTTTLLDVKNKDATSVIIWLLQCFRYTRKLLLYKINNYKKCPLWNEIIRERSNVLIFNTVVGEMFC